MVHCGVLAHMQEACIFSMAFLGVVTMAEIQNWAERSNFQSHSQPNSEFESSLGYIISPCLKIITPGHGDACPLILVLWKQRQRGGRSL